MSFELFKTPKPKKNYGYATAECMDMLTQISVDANVSAKTDLSTATIYNTAKKMGIKVHVSKLDKSHNIVWKR